MYARDHNRYNNIKRPFDTSSGYRWKACSKGFYYFTEPLQHLQVDLAGLFMRAMGSRLTRFVTFISRQRYPAKYRTKPVGIRPSSFQFA